jgi:hypothetical protein
VRGTLRRGACCDTDYLPGRTRSLLAAGEPARCGPVELAEQHDLDLSRPLHQCLADGQPLQRPLRLLAQHRGNGHRRAIPDLIIAATAEVHGAEVLHVDRDYDLIGEVTGQPMRRLLDPGYA